jgi:peptide/nickel transport system substrate-binding protein
MLIVATFMVSAIPYAVSVSPIVENAAADGPYVRVGYMQDVANWNPLNIELVSDYMICYLMFSVLFQYDENWEGPVNDLATDYYQVIHGAGNMTTYINITESAYFRNLVNPLDTTHQLTASDVAYTINLILDHPGGAWDIYMKDVTGANATSDPFQVAIDTAYPKGTIIEDLVWIPILPEYQWSTLGDSQILTGKKADWLIGSGPFVYEDQSKGVWYKFKTVPPENYHGSIDYGAARTVDIEGIIYTIYTDAQGLALALDDGVEDVIDISGQPNLFINELGDGDELYPIVKQVTNEMAIIDVAINAIPEDFTTNTYGLGNPILRDPFVREAIGMTMNRDFIANSLMFGMPMIADSVLADTGGQAFWHKDIDGVLPYDPAAAKTLLQSHGYRNLDTDAYLECDADSMSVLEGWADVGDELSFRLEVPDTDPTYATVGESWVGPAADAGIRFNYAVRSESIMINSAWYKSDYDIWVWAWYWGPEPIGTMSVWETSQIKGGGDNCQMPMGPWWYGPSNASESPTGEPYSAFDENLSLARQTLDRDDRKALLDTLQQWVYDSYTELPPIYPNGLYAWHEFRFTGWGNWTQHLGRSVSSDLPWIWFDLQWKGGNQAPSFLNPPPDPIQAEVDKPLSVTVTVMDPEGDQLNVSFEWGDGSVNDTDTATTGTATGVSFTKTHTYTSLVLPPDSLSLNVTVWDGTPGNIAIARSTVNVIPEPDSVPTLTTPVLTEPDADAYIDEMTRWSVGFKDAESGGDTGEGLRFTWDWDDFTYNTTLYQPTTNDTEVIDVVWHSWAVDGPYTVTLWVDDGSGLIGHNVSVEIPYNVIVNQPPSAPAISSITANVDVEVSCWATSIDVDGDPLRFTWFFGDGEQAVTETPAGAPGVIVVSSPAHTWATSGTYTVDVWVDDLTEEAGHNVTASITADIGAPNEDMAPCSLGLVATPNPSYPNGDVTFNASAVDTRGDPLTLYIEYGDGEAAVATTLGGSEARQYNDFVHAYDATGDYTVTLWADDGTAGNNVSLAITMTVQENQVPWLILPSEASAFYNVTFVVTPARVKDNDTADVLSVWYDWGDDSGSPSGDPPVYNGTHVYTTTGNMTVTVYVDDGTGLTGHNVSGTMTVTILENLRPTFMGAVLVTPDLDLYQPGDTLMFTVVVRDTEGDIMNITIDWGDGESSTIENIVGEPDTNITRMINHTFDEGRSEAYRVNMTVDDGQMQYHSVKTWVSTYVSINVEKEDGGISTMVLVGIALVAIIVIALVVFLLMKRKKGEPKAEGGMEGMAPPEPPPPTN